MLPKGYKFSEEYKKNMSKIKMGHFVSEETCKKISNVKKSKNLKYTEETKLKMSQAKLKNPVRYWLARKRPDMTGENHPLWKGEKPVCKNCGKKLSIHFTKTQLCILCFCKKNIGEKNGNWKNGITPVNHKVRTSLEMRDWRQQVFARDDFRCLDCGERGGELQADHIYPFALFPRLRLMLENGQTLCKQCHRAKTYFERMGVYSI